MENIKKYLFDKYKAWGWATSGLFLLTLYPPIVATILKDILIGFGVALFTSWVMLISFNKEFLELFCDNILPFRDQIKARGLIGIVQINRAKDLKIDLIHTDKLTIAMNDSKNFCTNNATELSERYKKSEKQTIFILLDPEESELLCKLNGKAEGFYKTKINDVISEIQQHKNSGANIEVYLTKTIFRTSMVLTDTVAISGTYRNSRGKDNIPPTYLYSSDGDEYKCIEQDISKLKTTSIKKI